MANQPGTTCQLYTGTSKTKHVCGQANFMPDAFGYIRCETAAAAGQEAQFQVPCTLSAPVPCRRGGRHHVVQANLWEVLTPGSLTPVVTSTIIAAATVILNLVAGIVTERKRAELSLEVWAELTSAASGKALMGTEGIDGPQRGCELSTPRKCLVLSVLGYWWLRSSLSSQAMS